MANAFLECVSEDPVRAHIKLKKVIWFWRLRNQVAQLSSFATAKLSIATVATDHVRVAKLSVATVAAIATDLRHLIGCDVLHDV
jgi:hypothetical protein